MFLFNFHESGEPCPPMPADARRWTKYSLCYGKRSDLDEAKEVYWLANLTELVSYLAGNEFHNFDPK